MIHNRVNGRKTNVRITDIDAYFFFTAFVIWLLFPNWWGRFHMFSRSRKAMKVTKHHMELFQIELGYMSSERFPLEVAEFIHSQHPYIPMFFLKIIIENFKIEPEKFTIGILNEMPDIYYEGQLFLVDLMESIVMGMLVAIVASENHIEPVSDWQINAIAEAKKLPEFEIPVAEGGTRRALSPDFRLEMLSIFKEHAGEFLRSTSNVGAAYQLGLWCYGTSPHFYYQLMAARY